jgi:hypothetical protein
MCNETDSLDTKVALIVRDLVGNRADRLLPVRGAEETKATIAAAIRDDYPEQVANDIGFHLTDWNADAAFLVALDLCPERFAADEVKRGLTNLLVHAPNHMAAAAKLAGHPISDVFGLGKLMEE